MSDHVTVMPVLMTESRKDAATLRRVSLLLHRLADDGHAGEPGLTQLESGLDLLMRAAVRHDAIEKTGIEDLEKGIAATLAAAPCGHAPTCRLLRWNVLFEINDLLQQLRSS